MSQADEKLVQQEIPFSQGDENYQAATIKIYSKAALYSQDKNLAHVFMPVPTIILHITVLCQLKVFIQINKYFTVS